MSKRKKKPIYKIDWYGNAGYSFPDPGTKKSVKCGVCGISMEVKRNVIGPTSWIEAAILKEKHLHDSFWCPYFGKNWHRRIYQLKINVYFAEVERRGDIVMKKNAANEIQKILIKKFKAE